MIIVVFGCFFILISILSTNIFGVSFNGKQSEYLLKKNPLDC
jgi:hypothetical protein